MGRIAITTGGVKQSLSNYNPLCIITEIKDENISVDINILEKRLEQYFQQYIKEIRQSDNLQLRENFIIAMNYICSIYLKDEKWEI